MNGQEMKRGETNSANEQGGHLFMWHGRPARGRGTPWRISFFISFITKSRGVPRPRASRPCHIDRSIPTLAGSALRTMNGGRRAMVRGADPTRIAGCDSPARFPRHFGIVTLILTFLTFLSATRAADVAISLPLQGHYRPGRYMPVRLVGQMDSPDGKLRLAGTSALMTDVQSSNHRIDCVIPWLSIGNVHDVRWSTSGNDHPIDLPLSPLDEDDRLIGYAGADPDILAKQFPDKKLIRVPLDLTDPLPGEITAWESLDGIVLDASSARRMTEGKIRGLLAAGTVIAIRSSQKPGGGWPWIQQGDCWIARANIAGPTSAYLPQGYEPTEIWLRGWPQSVRRQIMMAAIVFAILVAGAMMWRSKWQLPLIVLLCASATGAGLVWRAREPVGIEAGGSIYVRTLDTTQRDDWIYRAALREVDQTIPFMSDSRPVFASRKPPEGLAMRLVCSSDGKPVEFRFHLSPGRTMAFQSRMLVSGRQSLSPKMPVTSPLRLLAAGPYTMHDDRIIGEIAPLREDEWPGIVIERSVAPP